MRRRFFCAANCSPPASATGILLLVSLFERKVEILADVGLHARFDAADWRTVIDAMTPLLRERRCFGALRQGVGRIEAMLLAKGITAPRRRQRASRPAGSGERERDEGRHERSPCLVLARTVAAARVRGRRAVSDRTRRRQRRDPRAGDARQADRRAEGTRRRQQRPDRGADGADDSRRGDRAIRDPRVRSLEARTKGQGQRRAGRSSCRTIAKCASKSATASKAR